MKNLRFDFKVDEEVDFPIVAQSEDGKLTVFSKAFCKEKGMDYVECNRNTRKMTLAINELSINNPQKDKNTIDIQQID